MTDISSTGNGVVQLKVAIVVPSQCGNAVTAFKANLVQGVSHLANSAKGIFVSVSMVRVITSERNNFTRTIDTIRMLHYRGDRELRIHH